MLRIIFFLSCLGVFTAMSQPTELIEKRLIIQLKEPVDLSVETENQFLQEPLNTICELAGVVDIRFTGQRKMRKTLVLTFKNDIEQEANALIEAFTSTGLVTYAERDYYATAAGVQATTPNDAHYGQQWSHKNDGTFSLSPATAGADVDMENAWSITTGDSAIVLSILDSGSKLDHPEWTGRLWINPNEIPNNGVDDDANGFVDDIHGWDHINNDDDPTDDQGHGTNVAGIATATGNNSIGFAGVDWNCKLMTNKVLDNNNFGSWSAIAEGVYYAVDNGADVINMSLGGASQNITLENAINYAYVNGVIVVVSMMNFNNNVDYFPAAYAETIAVGSTDPDDKRTAPFFWDVSSGSNYGNHNDLVAPGNYMYGLSSTSNTNYGSYWGGTSQASPMVAGVCALLLAIKPSLGIEDVRYILRQTADDQVGDPLEDVAGWDIYHGAGRLNAYEALTFLQNNIGIRETGLKQIQVFPNPVIDGVLYLSSQSDGLFNVQVVDQFGKLVLNQMHELTPSKLALQLPELSSGVYYVTLVGEDVVETQKVIVVQNSRN